MDKIGTITQVRLLKESGELECKAAGGRDGRGQLPEDFWPSYSAFANTRGGIIILGISEPKSGTFTISGIVDPDRVVSEIFNLANNPQKISFNILSDEDVAVHKVDGKDVITVKVRRATRKEKPVYVGLNPLSGTYKRSHSGDRKCDSETVRRMIAEQVEDTRDARILRGFGIDSLDIDTVRAYRQALRNARPGHIALEHDDTEFLRVINAWKKDRESGIEGVTAAGLLMFGKLNEIWDVFPKYLVDYQEQPEKTRAKIGGLIGLHWTAPGRATCMIFIGGSIAS
ncbi:ATP-binding protein [Methylobacterium sp. DM1]|nr:ATP-binding protein [Methylobacterium sp. DM1]